MRRARRRPASSTPNRSPRHSLSRCHLPSVESLRRSSAVWHSTERCGVRLGVGSALRACVLAQHKRRRRAHVSKRGVHPEHRKKVSSRGAATADMRKNMRSSCCLLRYEADNTLRRLTAVRNAKVLALRKRLRKSGYREGRKASATAQPLTDGRTDDNLFRFRASVYPW